MPSKLLWKTKGSTLEADLQGKGGQRAPSAVVAAVTVDGLEGRGGRHLECWASTGNALRKGIQCSVLVHNTVRFSTGSVLMQVKNAEIQQVTMSFL